MRRSGFLPIVLATAIGGAAGYVVSWLVFRRSGAADYSVFAVFWSALYLVVGALAGIQQEVTRATRPRIDGPAAPTARNFALIAAVVVAIVIAALSPVWALWVFPTVPAASLVVALAAGAACYVMVAVLAGTLYGLSLWIPLAIMITVDGLVRLAAVAVALTWTDDPSVLAWAVVIAFPVSAVTGWIIARTRVVNRSRLDVAAARLTRNASATVVAAASTGVLISGFPVVLRLTSPSVAAAELGVLVLAVTVVRAPLIVTAMSLQSFLIMRFRLSDAPARFAGVLASVVVVGGGVLALLGWLLGPFLFRVIFGEEAEVSGALVAALVGSSALVAAMFVTGPSLLASGRHPVFTAGWVSAAVVTVIALVLPMDLEDRVLLALFAGPLVGLAVHITGLVRAVPTRQEATRASS